MSKLLALCVIFAIALTFSEVSGIHQKHDSEEIYINYAKENDTGDICSLPLETGRCLALFYRYGFDNSIKGCRKFMYGGCQRNANNFRTLEECEKACLRN